MIQTIIEEGIETILLQKVIPTITIIHLVLPRDLLHDIHPAIDLQDPLLTLTFRSHAMLLAEK